MGNRLNRHGGGGSDAVARGLFHGREDAIYGGGVERRGEHDGAVRAVRDKPQDRLPAVAPLSGRERGGTGGALARAACNSVGDQQGAGRGDNWGAPGASELGAQEAARELAAARARARLAGAEHYWRVAAAGRTERAAQAAPERQPFTESAAHGGNG